MRRQETSKVPSSRSERGRFVVVFDLNYGKRITVYVDVSS